MLKGKVKSKTQKEKIFYGSKKVTQVSQKIHSQRKSENASGSFGFKKTRKSDIGTLSEIFETI